MNSRVSVKSYLGRNLKNIQGLKVNDILKLLLKDKNLKWNRNIMSFPK